MSRPPHPLTENSDKKIEIELNQGVFLLSYNVSSDIYNVISGLESHREDAALPYVQYVAAAKDARYEYDWTGTAFEGIVPNDFSNNVEIVKDIIYQFRGQNKEFLFVDFELAGVDYKPFPIYVWKGHKHICIEYELDIDGVVTKLTCKRIT